MRRLVVAFAALAAAATGSLVLPAGAGSPLPIDGGTVVQECYTNASSQLDDPGYKFCRGVQGLSWIAAAQCRTAERELPDSSQPDYCGEFDGREIDAAKVAAYEQSWVHRALSMQRDLDANAPLWEEQLPHTHNTFNSSAYYLPTDGSAPSYYPTLTNQDPNQVYSITDQLRMDIRAIEIDAHWVPSPYGTAATHGYWPTMCHGDGEDPTGHDLWVHVGCTDDRPLQDGLAEVRRWLDANPHQFLMIYLENQLYDSPVASQVLAHDTAASLIAKGLGPLVYRPPAGLGAGTCAPMPYDETREQMLLQHKQVLLVGNCGPGTGWNSWVFTRGPSWDESGNPTNYSAADCAKDQAAREHHTSFRRIYEESPWLEAMTNATQVVTAAHTAAMVRCGVNIIGFDQLQPDDGRLAALVWSWAPDQPAGPGRCALRGSDGRFTATACSAKHHFACVDDHGDWHVSNATGAWNQGASVCRSQFGRSHFGVPANGYRDGQLGSAKAWVDYRLVRGKWTPNT